MKGVHIILEGQHGYPAIYGPFKTVELAILAAVAYFEARDAEIREGWETTIKVDKDGHIPSVTSDADGYEATAWIISDWRPAPAKDFRWINDNPA